ncbi:TSUP family transporter [Pseudazoarcus pumilus]|uniref:Probable membrane transporter protein n=1 Tax=Pseudazoarcus pumilus TaxID=2067960 RepID=A0A2I6S8L3_9RHOO|nr:TSUP family transporter [Pseudazoarcus pumilus]AUN95603.1 permease [Pseudazoarcus pumilus]
MENLHPLQYVAIGALFVWSGFVRAGLGFGGAVLVLPLLLLIVDDALVFLPVIAVHMLIFGLWAALRGALRPAGTTAARTSGVDWTYLARATPWMLPPAIVGIFGLLTLPPRVTSAIIFAIVVAYALGYVFARPIRSRGPKSDAALLALGGYVMGNSLIGGPLIVAVFAAHVARERLRDTLLVAWVGMVVIKLVSFVAAGVDLQLVHHVWLLPCALLGHVAGQRLHDRLLMSDATRFFRALGVLLLALGIFGLIDTLR